MKAVFTCGGTGGHINPALAVARVLLERRPDSEILFVGAEDGMEATLVPREGFRLETLQISSYMRSLKPSAIRHNVRAALSIRRALKKADRIVRLQDGKIIYDGDAHDPRAVVRPEEMEQDEPAAGGFSDASPAEQEAGA